MHQQQTAVQFRWLGLVGIETLFDLNGVLIKGGSINWIIACSAELGGAYGLSLRTSDDFRKIFFTPVGNGSNRGYTPMRGFSASTQQTSLRDRTLAATRHTNHLVKGGARGSKSMLRDCTEREISSLASESSHPRSGDLRFGLLGTRRLNYSYVS